MQVKHLQYNCFIHHVTERRRFTVWWLWHCHRPPISHISPTPGRAGSLVIRRASRHTRQEDRRLPQALVPEIEQQGTMDYHRRPWHWISSQFSTSMGLHGTLMDAEVGLTVVRAKWIHITKSLSLVFKLVREKYEADIRFFSPQFPMC